MSAALLPTWGYWAVGGAVLLVVLAALLWTRPGLAVLNVLLVGFLRACLWLRYRIRVIGLKEVARAGKTGILFLPNHPCLIDPIIVGVVLRLRFRPRPLADENQIDRFFVRWLAGHVNVLPIPDMAKVGSAGRERIRAAMKEIVEALRAGDNVVLHPAGRMCRSRFEDLRGTSAVETIVGELGDVRIVLMRTRGLWGSSFGWASGQEPSVGRALSVGLRGLLASGIFFAPRREVTVELHEPDDFPRSGNRGTINRAIEAYYNDDAPPNTFVPYSIWRRRSARVAGEPQAHKIDGDLDQVPPATRRIVTEYLEDRTGRTGLTDDQRLAHDLGLDSLSVADMVAWLESEFGFPQGNVESLKTVGDVMLAACGEAVATEADEIKPVRPKWFSQDPPGRLVDMPPGRTITEVFLAQAARNPTRLIAGDQMRGEKTYRDLITAVYVLKGVIEQVPGRHVGIMMPASVVADVLYLSTLFAGKTPVMVNWTVGPRNVRHALDLVGCGRVLTSRKLVTRLRGQGVGFEGVEDRFVYLEEAAGGISTGAKLRAAMKARFRWSELRDAEVSETAAVLLTSGSESLPKAVPLTHANILACIRAVIAVVDVYTDDRLLGMLPPFHSFGLNTGVVLPLVLGVKVVHHPNPTEGRMLGRLIEAYRATILIGTPTFLSGIVRASTARQLAALRLGVTGAEKCPDRVYDALAEKCPKMVILEGYGVTECSPMISVNDERDPRKGTIGKPLPCVDHVIVDVDTARPVETGRRGMLLVRGPTVFDGYINYDGPSPFVDFDGHSWYRTGDLVTEDADGVLTFRGRLKRFVKLGGEMISLPAVESVLEPHFPADDADAGAAIAVVATPVEDHPELVLFTTADTDRETVNGWIRESGLSALHNIRRIIRTDEIPALGTGKTNYRALQAQLREDTDAGQS